MYFPQENTYAYIQTSKVTNVRHAAANKHLVNLAAGHFRQQASVVGVIWGAENGLGNLVHVNMNFGGILSSLVGRQ